LLSVDQKEQIAAVVNLTSFPPDGFLLLVTRLGKIKKVALKNFASIRNNGLIAMNLAEEDELVVARTAQEEDDILLVGEKGEAIKFAVGTLRTASRTSGGVRGLRLAPGEHLAGADIASPGSFLLLVTANGFGKLTRVDAYPRQVRGGKGRRAYRVSSKTGELISAKQTVDSSELMLLSANGIIIRQPMNRIPLQGRNTQGASLMKLDPGDRVVSVECF